MPDKKTLNNSEIDGLPRHLAVNIPKQYMDTGNTCLYFKKHQKGYYNILRKTKIEENSS